jgi:hypothetical protein
MICNIIEEEKKCITNLSILFGIIDVLGTP